MAALVLHQETVWPVESSAFYDAPYVEVLTLQEFWLPLLGVTVVGVLLWWWRRAPMIPASRVSLSGCCSRSFRNGTLRVLPSMTSPNDRYSICHPLDSAC